MTQAQTVAKAHRGFGEFAGVAVIAVLACGLYLWVVTALATLFYSWSVILGLLFSAIVLYVAAIVIVVQYLLVEKETTWRPDSLVSFLALLPAFAALLCVSLGSSGEYHDSDRHPTGRDPTWARSREAR
jgi:hypothetical protein